MFIKDLEKHNLATVVCLVKFKLNPSSSNEPALQKMLLSLKMAKSDT